MNNPMGVDVMLKVAEAHRRDLYKDAEQRRLIEMARGDQPQRSILAKLISLFQREQPALEVVAAAETTEQAAVDPYKTQPLKAVRRTEELRRAFYEGIRQGNAMQELEEQGHWQAGGA